MWEPSQDLLPGHAQWGGLTLSGKAADTCHIWKPSIRLTSLLELVQHKPCLQALAEIFGQSLVDGELRTASEMNCCRYAWSPDHSSGPFRLLSPLWRTALYKVTLLQRRAAMASIVSAFWAGKHRRCLRWTPQWLLVGGWKWSHLLHRRKRSHS